VSRPLALIFGTGMTLAVLAPCLSAAPFADDSFPFSTYPMFARVIEKRVIVFADGVTSETESQRLGPELVANDEPMQAQRTLRLASTSGRKALRTLCARIAQRVAQKRELRAVSRVRIVQGVFDPVKYFEGDSAAESREILTECKVRRAE
jgi:hypothetical protein